VSKKGVKETETTYEKILSNNGGKTLITGRLVWSVTSGHLAGVGEQALTRAAWRAAMLGLIAMPGLPTLPAAGEGVSRELLSCSETPVWRVFGLGFTSGF